jgi:mannosyltransferase OCH1-like enzyme
MNGTLHLEMNRESYLLKNRIKTKSTYPTIFQTWVSHRTDNDRIWHCYQKIEELYKDHNYILFSDFEMKKFIRNEYNETICNQYDNIVPTAFKSDFFRYLYMWKNGGLYLDISVEPIENVFDYVSENSDNTDYQFISSNDNGLRNGIWNGMMFAVPKSPVMYSCICQIMKMTKSNIRACLDYTGPSVLGRGLRESGISMNEVLLFEFKDSKFIRDPKTGVVLFEPKNSKGNASRLTQMLYKQSTKSHYSTHCIYNQVFLYDA